MDHNFLSCYFWTMNTAQRNDAKLDWVDSNGTEMPEEIAQQRYHPDAPMHPRQGFVDRMSSSLVLGSSTAFQSE